MEYASLLAGEPWSDHPRCTHPALAQLARLINDATPPHERQRLTRLVPDVIGLAGPNPALAPTLVILCIDTAHAHGHHRWSWKLSRRSAQRRLAAVSTANAGSLVSRATDAVYREGPAHRTMTSTIQAIAGDTDHAPDTLTDLLESAIAVSRDCCRTIRTQGALLERRADVLAGVGPRDRAVALRIVVTICHPLK